MKALRTGPYSAMDVSSCYSERNHQKGDNQQQNRGKYIGRQGDGKTLDEQGVSLLSVEFLIHIERVITKNKNIHKKGVNRVKTE